MTQQALTSRADLIESKLDRDIAGKLAITLRDGGTSFENMAEVLEFAKLMSISKQAVPQHCREQPGVCLGITIQAVEWRMSPFAVANKSYVVNDRLSYESQLIHAVVESRAPITGRLRHEFSGEGAGRKCRVWATEQKSNEELSYESPEIGTIQPKNSPLWKTKPDLQLYYNTSRDWARVYFPDVILGVYSNDELLDTPLPNANSKLKVVGSIREAEGVSVITQEQRVEIANAAKVSGANLTEIVQNAGFEMLANIPVDAFDGILAAAKVKPEPPDIQPEQTPEPVAKTEPEVSENVPDPNPRPADSDEDAERSAIEAEEPVAQNEPSSEVAKDATPSPLESLRANVQAALDELTAKDRKNVIAGKKALKDMDSDELNQLGIEIRKY